MKKNKEIIVYRENSPFIPTNISEFMNFWDEKISNIPDEYKNTAQIEIEIDRNIYDDFFHLIVRVYYIRLETDEEEIEREKNVKEREEILKNKELKELERLRKKYNV